MPRSITFQGKWDLGIRAAPRAVSIFEVAEEYWRGPLELSGLVEKLLVLVWCFECDSCIL